MAQLQHRLTSFQDLANVPDWRPDAKCLKKVDTAQTVKAHSFFRWVRNSLPSVALVLLSACVAYLAVRETKS